MKFLNPEAWVAPKGYSNGVAVKGTQVYVAGQIGWDATAKLVSKELLPQVKQALENIVAILEEAGAKPEHVTRLTWFVTDKKLYLAATKEIGSVYRDLFGKHFPAMTLLQVADLLEEGALVEIEATAVIPE